MRSSPMLEFPLEEYENRIAILVENMKKAGMDGVMVTSMEGVRYYTGLQSVIWPSKYSTPGLILLNADGEIYIVGSASAQDTARFSACVDDDHVIHFSRNGIPGVALTYPEAIIDTIRKLKLDRAKLGIEYGSSTKLHLQMQWMDEIVATLPDMQLMDASDSLWTQRSIKSAAEIEIYRELSDITDKIYTYAMENIELGKTSELGVYQLLAQEAFRLHCENMPPMGILFGKNRYLNGNCPPRDDVIIENIPHAILQIDGGPRYKGYVSDIIRMGVVGGLNEKQQFIMDAADDALAFALSEIRAGVVASDVCKKLDDHVRRGPAAEYYGMYTWAGHGIGLDIHEPPTIATACDIELKAGMIMAIEPIFGDAELGVFGNEQNILITDDGCEVLNKMTTKPIILR